MEGEERERPGRGQMSKFDVVFPRERKRDLILEIYKPR